MHAVEVEDRDPAELAHRDREVDVDDAIHGRAPEGQRQGEAIAHRECDLYFVGIERHAAGHEGDLVEPIRAAGPPADPDLEIPT